MKTFLTGTAFLAMLVPIVAIGAEMGAPPPPETSRMQVSPNSDELHPLIQNTSGAAVLSSGALSVHYLKGTSIYDNSGKEAGKIDDIVLGSDGKASSVIVGVGGFAGFGAKEISVNYGELTLNGQSPKSPTALLDSGAGSLKSKPEFDGKTLPAGQSLASQMIGTGVTPKGEKETSAKLSDIILDHQGTAKFAAIEYGGIAGVGGRRVAVDYSRLGTFTNGQPLSLDLSMAELQAERPFIYEADDTTASIPSTMNSVKSSLKPDTKSIEPSPAPMGTGKQY